MKIVRAIWNYLKDWRNWLTHSIFGVGLLLIALYLPVKPLYRILVLLIVITFNTIRMIMAKKKKEARQDAHEDILSERKTG